VAGANPEERVAWPLIYQRWRTFTFLHWAYDPADLQRLLPSGLDVHTYDGVAWVGLTPFLLCDFRPPGFPTIPGLSTFPETNVRTYVINRSGRDGIRRGRCGACRSGSSIRTSSSPPAFPHPRGSPLRITRLASTFASVRPGGRGSRTRQTRRSTELGRRLGERSIMTVGAA